MKLAYLAQPYSHPSWFVREERYLMGVNIAGVLADQYHVYSPIVHCHSIDQRFPLPHELWMQHSLSVLARCDLLLFAPLAGWRQSKGLARELSFAKHAGLEIVLLQGQMLENLGLFEHDSYAISSVKTLQVG